MIEIKQNDLYFVQSKIRKFPPNCPTFPCRAKFPQLSTSFPPSTRRRRSKSISSVCMVAQLFKIGSTFCTQFFYIRLFIYNLILEIIANLEKVAIRNCSQGWLEICCDQGSKTFQPNFGNFFNPKIFLNPKLFQLQIFDLVVS